MRFQALAALLFMAPALAGCLGFGDEGLEAASLPDAIAARYDRTGDFSRTLLPGSFDILPVELVTLPSFDGVELSLGVYRPDTTERVPVIVDVGPYYSNGDLPVDEPAERLGRFLIENFVPHGYAVVQASIRGTGWSGGCMDFMGLAEQQDMDALVTYLGEVDWSSGAVAMIGRSYDGSTPWQAAQFGNPYLKTIVPIAGLTDVGDLYFRNGSSEWRAPTLGAQYWTYGFADNGRSNAAKAQNVLCAQGIQGVNHALFGAVGALNGGGTTPATELEYWRIRNFKPQTLANYRGSVFIVHGLQDWNVEPHMVAPFFNDLKVEKKMWLGQWGHHYPDRPDEHEHLRWDFADALLRWFDKHLKQLPVSTGPVVEVEDNLGKWRGESAWPPQDAVWQELHLDPRSRLVTKEPEQGRAVILAPALAPYTGLGPNLSARFVSENLTVSTRISGLPQLHLTAIPFSAGGHLYAELYDVGLDGETLLGHAQMDLRYHGGGRTQIPVVPTQQIKVQMEFFPLDVHVPEGHAIALVITQEVRGDPMPSPLTGPIDLVMGGDMRSVLRLPTISRAPSPTAWDHVHADEPGGD